MRTVFAAISLREKDRRWLEIDNGEDMKKVCVVYNHDSSWVHNDIDILKKHFDVYEYFYKRDKKTFDLKEIIKDVDFVFIWFASYHGLKAVRLAKKYEKKIVTVSGGYDVSTIKNYGLASNIRTRWIPKYILKNSDIILAFSNSSKREIEALTDTDVVVSFGVDTDSFYPGVKKEDMVLTVAYLDSVSWKRKGIDRFLELAQMFALKEKHTKFVVVGKLSNEIQGKVDGMFTKGIIPNIEFVGYVTHEELLKYYQRSKVYVQLSTHEGFCSVVAEAMLCNCIPVVSNVGSLPEVVGDKGIVVNYHTDLFDVSVMSLGMHSDGQREWILNNFSLEKREDVLLEALN